MNHINRLLAVLSIALSVGAMEQPAGVTSSDQIQVINRTNKEIELFFERTGKKSLVFKPGETKQLANFDPKRHTILFQGKKVLPSANARYVDEKTGKIKYHIYDHYVLKMIPGAKNAKTVVFRADDAQEVVTFPTSIRLSNTTNTLQQFESIDHVLQYYKIKPQETITLNVKNVEFVIGYDAEVPSKEDPMFLELTGIPLVRSPLFPPKVAVRELTVKDDKGRTKHFLYASAYQEPKQQKMYKK